MVILAAIFLVKRQRMLKATKELSKLGDLQSDLPPLESPSPGDIEKGGDEGSPTLGTRIKITNDGRIMESNTSVALLADFCLPKRLSPQESGTEGILDSIPKTDLNGLNGESAEGLSQTKLMTKENSKDDIAVQALKRLSMSQVSHQACIKLSLLPQQSAAYQSSIDDDDVIMSPFAHSGFELREIRSHFNSAFPMAKSSCLNMDSVVTGASSTSGHSTHSKGSTAALTGKVAQLDVQASVLELDWER